MTKVLVVAVEASISDAVAYALRREGYTVETAADGQEALDRVDTFHPDVMVLDVMMPKPRLPRLPSCLHPFRHAELAGSCLEPGAA
ncbi:hypothetical protein HMSSN036_11630 [Paenibacillus macerans]|nr:hypothetical protein HMSSN036_11630 [Paenibacillus macerans]